jgi:hypothetical protein
MESFFSIPAFSLDPTLFIRVYPLSRERDEDEGMEQDAKSGDIESQEKDRLEMEERRFLILEVNPEQIVMNKERSDKKVRTQDVTLEEINAER